MGQYYHPIILHADGSVLVWMFAHAYNNGLKLMEHSYLKNAFVSTFEYGLCPEGRYHKSRVVWAGDYAEIEPGSDKNLYDLCDEYNRITPMEKSTAVYQYVVNHSKRQFVDKSRIPTVEQVTIHPLPLLTCEGNGLGNGDFRGEGESTLIGSWARDVISVEVDKPVDFEEIVFDLVELP